MIKKIAYKILCNSLTGAFINYVFNKRIPDIRWRGFRYNVEGIGMSKTIIASIFWGFYESAEIRFVEKYFNGEFDAVELGASNGIVSSHILKKLKENKRWIGVEANQKLKNNCLENIAKHNKKGLIITLLNYAIYYDADKVQFNFSSNTTASRLVNIHIKTNSSVIVPAITLSNILKNNNINKFALFCDIEGAESGIFLNEDLILQNCMELFIELHDIEYRSVNYSINDLESIIKEKGFQLVDRHGPVFYFNRSR